jgi:hypothetical protein
VTRRLTTPLLRSSPYNQAHIEIQKYFGGIEPLIIVVEGRQKDVLKIRRFSARWKSFNALGAT